jgi:hypothetical protein
MILPCGGLWKIAPVLGDLECAWVTKLSTISFLITSPFVFYASMGTINMRTKKLAFIRPVLIVTITLMVLCLCAVVTLTTNNPITVRMERRNPAIAALSFSEALRNNDRYAAKQLSDPNVWAFVEDWMNNHEVVRCSSIVTQPTGFGPVSSAVVKIASTAFVCVTESNRVYCFSMENIVVEEKGRKGWFVTGWEHIEENRDC